MRVLPTTISEASFVSVVRKISDPKEKLALLLGFYQCMRVSEVRNLKPENVDKDRGFLFISQAKGKKDRYVPIMPPVARGLRHLPINKSIRTLQRTSQKHLGIRFHALRHSGATFYLNDKKVDVRVLQQLLGHSRLDTTQIYTHVNPENLKSAFQDIWS